MIGAKRKAKKPTANRRSFHFPLEAAAHFNAIKQRVHCDNGSDVIRAALAEYEQMLDITDADADIVVRTKDGAEFVYSPYKPFTYPGFDRVTLTTPEEEKSAKPANFVFSGDDVVQIERIKSRIRVGSLSDVLRISLAKLRDMLLIEEAGDSIWVRDLGDRWHKYRALKPFSAEALTIPAPERALKRA